MTTPVGSTFFTPKNELGGVLKAPKVGEKEFENQYSDVCNYNRIHFWDQRYLDDLEPFEWFYPYEQFAEIVNERVAKEARILDAGCGNSELILNLADDGFTDITGVDWSRVVIDQLKTRCKDYDEIQLKCLNMQDTNLPKDSYDCIIDKGLLDSIICNMQSTTAVANYITEVERLLVEDGIFIVISMGTPDERLKYIEHYDIDVPNFTPWYTDVIAMDKPRIVESEELDPDDMNSYYFVYICRVEPKLVKQKKDRVKQLAIKKKRLAKLRKKNHKNDL
mmetsp:Transcript_18028/g.30167  ORF Transcript_18028/g.30167 Transcript_18028/m.30167 type:complete len:278 (-) Transcript_18028:278-1111(-)|eukprot:CAMPEP_0114435084 /NCGR_PEP_ID=MMETSP0103-20121206/12628_1 /TAXON_ID=37642 ORGANISM="Paraphysomonas imperforata, Strain PA2" /NCGR_SAMPLE_ID=MMETSP0103 /ASSEMBLY_ACC=CAM_ASM_000201 /LENGTH=277 /DNA_ID=CAMNT_0001605059 /DNA_START=71 /DNA_END=904 /DNA_ORIENTATION=-